MKKGVFCLCLLLSGCITSGRLYYIAPTILPGTEIEMNNSGFWISKHPFPDRVILTSEKIKNFNFSVQKKLRFKNNIFKHPDCISGERLISSLTDILGYFSKRDFYTFKGRKVKSKRLVLAAALSLPPS